MPHFNKDCAYKLAVKKGLNEGFGSKYFQILVIISFDIGSGGKDAKSQSDVTTQDIIKKFASLTNNKAEKCNIDSLSHSVYESLKEYATPAQPTFLDFQCDIQSISETSLLAATQITDNV